MCMASKVQSLVSENRGNSTELKNMDNIPSWTDELMPSIKKLRQAIQCLLRTAKLTYGIISLKVGIFLINICIFRCSSNLTFSENIYIFYCKLILAMHSGYD